MPRTAWTPPRSRTTLLLALLLLATPGWAGAQIGFGFGTLIVNAELEGAGGVSAMMRTCVFAQVPGPPLFRAHEDPSGPVAPVPCTIALTGGPFGALGPLTGEGVPSAELLPAFDVFSELSGPTVQALAGGSGTEHLDPGHSSWDVSSFAPAFLGGPGIAAAQTQQTWLIVPDDDLDLALAVDLFFVDLLSELGPVASADAVFELAGGFGAGAVPFANTLASWSYLRAVSGDQAISESVVPLLDGTFALTAGQPYWLAVSLGAGAVLGPEVTAVPEPATAWLLAAGLSAVAAVAGVTRRRATGGRGR